MFHALQTELYTVQRLHEYSLTDEVEEHQKSRHREVLAVCVNMILWDITGSHGVRTINIAACTCVYKKCILAQCSQLPQQHLLQ